MGYSLFAFIGKQPELQTIAGKYKNAKVIMVKQGIGIIPLSHDLYDEINNFESADEVESFIYLNSNIQTQILQLIKKGVIAYIEADYSGGIGEQEAILWNDGVKTMYYKNRLGAINSILRRLGVSASNEMDEFDTVDLGRNRSVDEWLEM
jgi:hypothetical protein